MELGSLNNAATAEVGSHASQKGAKKADTGFAALLAQASKAHSHGKPHGVGSATHAGGAPADLKRDAATTALQVNRPALANAEAPVEPSLEAGSVLKTASGVVQSGRAKSDAPAFLVDHDLGKDAAKGKVAPEDVTRPGKGAAARTSRVLAEAKSLGLVPKDADSMPAVSGRADLNLKKLVAEAADGAKAAKAERKGTAKAGDGNEAPAQAHPHPLANGAHDASALANLHAAHAADKPEAGKPAKDGAVAGLRAGAQAERAGVEQDAKADTVLPEAVSVAFAQRLEAVAEKAQIAAPVSPYAVEVPVGQQGWAAAISKTMVNMLADGVTQAVVSINPEHLGPVDIKISMENGIVDVDFFSPYQEVRDALVSSGDQLQARFAEAGVKLDRVDAHDTLPVMSEDFAQDRGSEREQRSGQQEQRRDSRRENSWLAEVLRDEPQG